MSAPLQRASADARAPASAAKSAVQDGLGDFVRSVRVHWWLILLLVAGSAGAATAWTVRQPRIYQATCTVEFDPNPVRPLGDDIADIGGPSSDFWMSREFFATQQRVLGSRHVAELVVERLHLHVQRSFVSDPEDLPAGWSGISVPEAARLLQDRISIEDVRGTRLVLVNVRDTDPQRAALIANTLVAEFAAKTIRDRSGSTEGALDQLEEQLVDLRGQLEASELALHRFKIEHNVLSVSLEDSQNLVAAEIERFSTALSEVRAERIALSARVARIRAILAADDIEEQATALTEVASVQTLRTELRAKLAERDGLTERYGPNHPRMVELQAQISGLREQLRGELTGLLRAAEADVRQAQATEAGLRTALEQAHAAGLELNMREIEYSRLSRTRENNVKLYELVLQRTAAGGMTSKMAPQSFVRPVDDALPPATAVSPRVSVNVGVGSAVGLILGLLIAFVLGHLDTRVRSLEEFEEFGAAVLGVLPRMDEGAATARATKRRGRRGENVSDSARDLIAHRQPLSAIAENLRTIRTNLVFMGGEEQLRSIAVTSANPREGKTLIVANLAISLAQSGKRVLVVDTDLRRPRVHRAYGLINDKGVTTVIAGQVSLSEAVQSSVVPGVDVLASGPIPPNPAELLHREAFKQLVAEAERRYDVVIFDSPPLGAVIDAAVLGPQVNGVIVVARPGETTRPALRAIIRQLHDVGANLLGAIVNGLDPRGRSGYYAGSGYYYYRRDKTYYAADAEGHDDVPRSADDRERPHMDS